MQLVRNPISWGCPNNCFRTENTLRFWRNCQVPSAIKLPLIRLATFHSSFTDYKSRHRKIVVSQHQNPPLLRHITTSQDVARHRIVTSKPNFDAERKAARQRIIKTVHQKQTRIPIWSIEVTASGIGRTGGKNTLTARHTAHIRMKTGIFRIGEYIPADQTEPKMVKFAEYSA